MSRDDRKLGQILKEKGYITEAQLNAALSEQARTGEFIGLTLVRLGTTSEQDLTRALSEQFQIPAISLENKPLPLELLRKFSPTLILDAHCLPLKEDEWSVQVAITNPLDMWVIKQAEDEARGKKVRLILVTLSEMNEAIIRYNKYLSADASGKLQERP
jgi:hypothetical protein